MKRGIIFALIVFLLLVVGVNAIAVYVPDSQLKFKVLRYEPAPVQAGDQFTIWLELTNEDSNFDYNDVSIKALSGNPFSVVGTDTVILGDIKGGNSQFFNFRIRADENALPGIYNLNFEVKYNGGISVVKDMKIELKTRDAFLNIESVISEPELLNPGSKGKLTLMLRNNAGTFLSDVNVALGLTNESIPLVTVGSTAIKNIPKIEANSKYNITFDLFVMADAESQAYRLPIYLTYYDASGVNYSRSNYIGVLVGADPEYILSLKSSDAKQEGSSGKVVLSISNTGMGDLKFLSLKLMPSNEYEIISADDQYIGNLESDDYETAEYNIYVDDSTDGFVKLKVKLDYKDAYNNKIEKIEMVDMPIYSSGQLARYGLAVSQSKGLMYLIYLIMVIYVFMAYKEWKRDKDLVKALKGAFLRFLKGVFNIIRGLRWRNLKRWPTRIKLFLMKDGE